MAIQARGASTCLPRSRSITVIMGLGLVGALLTTVPSAAAIDENMVVNPGFEEGTSGWSASGGTFTVSDDAASGDHSGALTDRNEFYEGIRGTLTDPLAHDGHYRIEAEIKHDGSASEPFGFAFCPIAGSCIAAADAIQQIPRGEWTNYSLDFVPNESPNFEASHETATFSNFQFETPWSSTVDFQIDNVSLTKVQEVPTGPESATAVEDIQAKPVGDHNPLMGHKFGADPHHLVYNGRLYIYSTSDEQQYQTAEKTENGLPVQGGGYDRITTLNVMSTDDMVNWVDHGAIPVAGKDGIAPWASNSWAPAAVSADLDGDGTEEVYLYFANGGSGTGVIVGGSPLGPWDDPNGQMLISQYNPIHFPNGMWLFDPEMFVDDDGQPYLYFGGNWSFAKDPYHPKSTRVVKLDRDDYSKLDDPTGGGITEIDAPGIFEASSMFERDGKYYYSYSSNFAVGNPLYDDKKILGQDYPGAGQIAYMISDDPMDLSRDKFAGTLFAAHGKWFPGSGGNNHSDLFEYKGKTYFTYHTQVMGLEWGKELNNGEVVNYRSVHLDEVNFNEDGTIQEVEGTTAGVDQIKDFDPYRTFESETLAWQLGVRTAEVDTPSVEFPEHNGNGNTVLTKIDDGDFTGISSVDFGDGASTVTATVKPLVEDGSVEVRLDSEEGPVVATIQVDSSLNEWNKVSADVSGATGAHDLFFVFRGPEGERLMEVDNWEFTEASEAPALNAVVDVTQRCVAGSSVVAVSAQNTGAVAVDLTVSTPFGTRTMADVQPGSRVSSAFSSRQSGIPGDSVHVSMRGTVDGEPVDATIEEDYAAHSCG